MTESQFKVCVVALAAAFTAIFSVLVIPPLIQDPDVLGAFAAGFVNPYSSGYSSDVIVCWFILAAWVAFEAREKQVRHGWICLVVGLVPGVAVGFAAYLLLRMQQLDSNRA